MKTFVLATTSILAASLSAPADAGGLFSNCFKKKSQSCCEPAPVTCCQPVVVMDSYATPAASSYYAPATEYSTSPVYSPAPSMDHSISHESAPQAVESYPSPVIDSTPSPQPSSAPAAPVADSSQSSSASASYQAALNAITNIKNTTSYASICELKEKNQQYGSIVSNLNPSQKAGDGGLCFPTEQYWNANPGVAAEITSILQSINAL